MAERSLTLHELLLASDCKLTRFSKAKRGPRTAYFCANCRAFSRSNTCVLDKIIEAFPTPEGGVTG